MEKKQINIQSLKGLKRAELYQSKGWTCIYNGFFNPCVTMVKGTQKEIQLYKEGSFFLWMK